MQAYKIETAVEQDDTVILRRLPFRAGERVEVIVLPAGENGPADKNYPVQGTPYHYDRPTEPVAETDWEATE